MKRCRLLIVALCLLGSVGFASQQLLKETWQELREDRFKAKENQAETETGKELVWSLLGSFRYFVADLSFLNGYYHWQEQRHDESNLWHAWATSLDPDNLLFWQVRVRVIGRDTPVWEIEQIGWFPDVDPEIREKIFIEYAEKGLSVVEEALRYHPKEVSLWMDKGLFYEMRLKDFSKAAEAFLIAWELNKNFLPSGVMYLEMLRRMGDRAAAQEFLRNHPEFEKML